MSNSWTFARPRPGTWVSASKSTPRCGAGDTRESAWKSGFTRATGRSSDIPAVGGDGQVQRVSFAVTPQQAGPRIFRVVVDPAAGEFATGRQRGPRVYSDSRRAPAGAAVGRRPSEDLAFLRRSLRRGFELGRRGLDSAGARRILRRCVESGCFARPGRGAAGKSGCVAAQ